MQIKWIVKQQGSTLIEVLISMVILAITAMGSIALYTNAAEIKSLSIHKKIATEIACSKLEDLRDVDYDDPQLDEGTTQTNVTIGGLNANVADGNGMTVTITEVPASYTYKRVQVDVDWDEAGQYEQGLNVSLLTYVGS